MNAQLCHMLGYILCYKYHVGSIITLLLTIGQAQLINWTNFILDTVTNYIETSLGRASYSLWTSLAKGNRHWFKHSTHVSYIVHDLGALRIAQKIQVMGFL